MTLLYDETTHTHAMPPPPLVPSPASFGTMSTDASDVISEDASGLSAASSQTSLADEEGAADIARRQRESAIQVARECRQALLFALDGHRPLAQTSTDHSAACHTSTVSHPELLSTPFDDGLLPADWTASGMASNLVEDFIRNKVRARENTMCVLQRASLSIAQALPLYANTHSQDSTSGQTMNALREARSRDL